MKRRHMFYFICIIGLIILIATAFLAPQFIFDTQDSLRERNISLGKRGSLDITRLNLSYEKSLSKRMTSFSRGIAEEKKYYVAATTYTEEDYNTNNEELYNVIQNMPYSYNIMLLYQEGFLPEMIFYPFDENNVLNSLKRYVIYDEDFQDGAALMAWYVDLYLDTSIRLRVLADVETSTIYYAQIDYPEELKKYILSYMTSLIYDFESAYYTEELVNMEYETDKAKQESEESDISYEDKAESEFYAASKETTVAVRERNMIEFLNSYEPQEYVRRILLSYAASNLEYKIEYVEEENRLTLGITEIGRLIPDFAEK